jgi:hypothetical protein
VAASLKIPCSVLISRAAQSAAGCLSICSGKFDRSQKLARNLKKENRMSKTWEHYHHASRHHERAAYHYKEAAKYDEAEEHEKAAHHAYLAHGHNQHAMHHDAEAAKLHAEQCDRATTAASEQEAKKKR